MYSACEFAEFFFKMHFADPTRIRFSSIPANNKQTDAYMIDFPVSCLYIAVGVYTAGAPEVENKRQDSDRWQSNLGRGRKSFYTQSSWEFWNQGKTVHEWKASFDRQQGFLQGVVKKKKARWQPLWCDQSPTVLQGKIHIKKSCRVLIVPLELSSWLLSPYSLVILTSSAKYLVHVSLSVEVS